MPDFLDSNAVEFPMKPSEGLPPDFVTSFAANATAVMDLAVERITHDEENGLNRLAASTIKQNVTVHTEVDKIHSENYGSEISEFIRNNYSCLLYTSPSPRDLSTSRMPSSA